MTAHRRGFRITDDADEDLRSIAAYIARDRISASIRVIDALHTTFRVLADEPDLGETCRELERGLRRFIPRRPANRYVIYYRPSAQSSTIDIVGVIHGRETLMTLCAAVRKR